MKRIVTAEQRNKPDQGRVDPAPARQIGRADSNVRRDRRRSEVTAMSMNVISPENEPDGDRPTGPNAKPALTGAQDGGEGLASLTALVEQALEAADEMGLAMVGIQLCSALESLKKRARAEDCETPL